MTKKRSAPSENENHISNSDIHSKRLRYGPHDNTNSVTINDVAPDRRNGISSKPPVMDGELTPVEQMISMIGALIAEGDRGVESIELLIANMHPDLLADIVITNMKHLPKLPPPIGNDNFTSGRSAVDSCKPEQEVVSNGLATSSQNLSIAVEVPITSSNLTSIPPLLDISSPSNLSTDTKRDPRRVRIPKF